MATVKTCERCSPLKEQIKELWTVCGVIAILWRYATSGWSKVTWKTRMRPPPLTAIGRAKCFLRPILKINQLGIKLR